MNSNELRAARTGEASFGGAAPVDAFLAPRARVKVAGTLERMLAAPTSTDAPVAREAARVA